VGFSPKERNYTEIERGAVIPNTSANMILWHCQGQFL
jgi:hypothetical protein